MKIELENASAYQCDEKAIKSLADFTLNQLGIHADSELSIRLVDEQEITDLHMKWMDLPGATDVLSFPMDEMKPNSAALGAGIIGDIVLRIITIVLIVFQCSFFFLLFVFLLL